MQQSSQDNTAAVPPHLEMADPQIVAPSTGKQPPAEELPLDRAYYWEKTRPHRLFLTHPVDGRARHWRWAEVMDESRRVAAFLRAQNWPPRSRIVILSRNCAWWLMSELAIWMSGHVTVPIYTSLTAEAARRLLAHCEPVACFLGTLDNPDLVSELGAEIQVIRFPTAPETSGVEWQTIVAEHAPLSGNPARAADELATIIYTSGTTGPPKGVMHRFGAFPYFAKAVEQATGSGNYHRAISYLPLAHIAERALTETASLYRGWRIFFCENPATFLRDLKRARPTVFFSVPRLYAKFQAGVFEKVPAPKLERLLRLPLIGCFVRRRILRQLGLNRVRMAASGSAPIPLELVLWFRKLGLPIAEGYGTTESGITHTAPKGQWNGGTVGTNAPGVETRISQDGEIQVRSPMNMIGYYRDAVATGEVFTEDGFVRSGDLGEIDSGGWLRIKGRIKEQFKTAKGKYVLPSAIEMMLGTDPSLENCLVMGSGLPAPIAVAVLSPAAQAAAETPAGRSELEHSLSDLRERINRSLAPHERIASIALTKTKWTIENGSLTPTLKLRRAVLENRYSPLLEEGRRGQNAIFWLDETQNQEH